MELKCVNIMVAVCTDKRNRLVQYYTIVLMQIPMNNNMRCAHEIPTRGVKFQADVANNTSFIKSLIKNSWKSAFTERQSNNESLNGTIWKKCPKYVVLGNVFWKWVYFLQ